MGCGPSSLSETSSVQEDVSKEDADLNQNNRGQVALKGADYRDLLTAAEPTAVHTFPKAGFQVRCATHREH